MGYDSVSPPPRRSRQGDGDPDEEPRGSRKSRGDGHGSDRRRDRDGSADRDRERRRHRRSRSRSPHSGRRERERERDGRRDRARGRDHDREKRRRASPDDDRRERRDRDRPRKRDRTIEEGGSERDDRQVVKRNGPLPPQAQSFALEKGEEVPKEKEKPNRGTTGTLAAASNSIAQADGSTIVLKYHEPPEARKPSPKDQWKLFVFKGPDIIDTIELNHRTCWLIGREMAVIDIAAEHPSISKQHAVIQFRYLEKRNEYGDKIGKVKPYVIDLDSANGTLLNSKKIADSRYLELQDKDLLQFGQSTREYVLMLAPKN
ncbi:hypothetical protein JX265_012276 [Neoarthrinium moseri]|uniref:FHA domain-containing protein n=1 Tax=Neoarthrinium moseri TaxID=1658444 RepID=A0A9P9WB61_9PEZI|nr:hypothetical protein JX265_012276 [Neoarthrinium moseri]